VNFNSVENLDVRMLLWANQFVGTNVKLDHALVFITENPTLRFILPSLLLWTLWFSAKTSDEQRARMLSGIIGCYAAALLSRFGQGLVFVHTRPILSPLLLVKIAPRIDIASWSGARNFNSFPSDFACLFFAISTVIFFVNKKYGVLAYLWSLVVCGVVRVYLAIHFPLDVLGGATLGVVAVAVFSREFIYARLTPLVRLASTHPVVFYPIFVLIVEQMWEAFSALVFVGFAIVKLFEALSRHL
jgi:membrane-associated phospholipid phosphatase